eukprot:TRINITY_DN16783_c0_g1_i1.p1 TRINITY_DN16783_c0_g1~~TRINITY_DN16783_c0_g1_i1.p1  ORF type:complete len:232 (+),score=29.68 TRINITY_DN16783_c0_g1_i1:56-751(+)
MLSRSLALRHLRINEAALCSIRGALASLPLKRYDRKLAKKFQTNPEEYERRSQKNAAVAVPLCNVDGEASCLFTVRSTKVGTHAGHVSFPGGHVDAGESAEEAAQRELLEETGLTSLEALGRWHPVRAVTGTMVTPVVGFIRQDLTKQDVDGMVAAANSANEVQSCFTISLQSLADPSKRDIQKLQGRWEMPRFLAGPQPVWGLTAFILDGVLRDSLSVLIHEGCEKKQST